MRSSLTVALLMAPFLGQSGSLPVSGGTGTAIPPRGLLLTVVRGPAVTAGLKRGDIVTRVHGVPWEARSEQEWLSELARSSPTKSIPVTFVRDGQQQDAEVQPEWTLARQLPRPNPERASGSVVPALAPSGTRMEVKSRSSSMGWSRWLGSFRSVVIRSTSLAEESTASWPGGPQLRTFRCAGETSMETSDGCRVRWTGEGWVFWDSSTGFSHAQISSYGDFRRAISGLWKGWGMTLVDRDVEARCDPRLEWDPSVEWGFGGSGFASWSDRGQAGQRTPDGVVVYAVARDSPAERAGLLPGDAVVDVNGKSITSKPELFGVMCSSFPDQLCRIGVRRGETGALRSFTLRVEPGSIPDRPRWGPVKRRSEHPTLRSRGAERILEGTALGTIYLEFPPGVLDFAVAGATGAMRSTRFRDGRLTEASFAMQKHVSGTVVGKRGSLSLRADRCLLFWDGRFGSRADLVFGANPEKPVKR